MNRRATVRGASAPTARNPGTSPASVSCPPTHTVAATTCRNTRTVAHVTGSTAHTPDDDVPRQAAGSRTVATSPPPARGASSRVPSCAAAIRCTIASPKPTPA